MRYIISSIDGAVFRPPKLTSAPKRRKVCWWAPDVKTAADIRSYGAVSAYQVMQLTTLSSTAHDAASTPADVESSTAAAAPDADTDGQNETELQLKRAQVCHSPPYMYCTVW